MPKSFKMPVTSKFYFLSYQYPIKFKQKENYKVNDENRSSEASKREIRRDLTNRRNISTNYAGLSRHKKE
jgi:hypothetical protein